jgi:hypothetical protein
VWQNSSLGGALRTVTGGERAQNARRLRRVGVQTRTLAARGMLVVCTL